MKLPDNILIYGLGMMGASISLALQKNSPCTKITGVVKTSEEVMVGERKKSADCIFTEEMFLEKGSFHDYGMIIFALPVDLAPARIDLIPLNYKGIITDICSVKNEIINHIEKKFTETHNYISSHPMTGSEESGLLHANSDLYSGRLCILTVPKKANPETEDFIVNFWKYLGMSVYKMDASSHDRIMAYVSHVPHILSTLMTLWAFSCEEVQFHTEKSEIPLTGGGFRDMVRIAGSNPEMWDAIIGANKNEIRNSIIRFRNELNGLLEILDQDDLKEEPEGFWEEYFKNSKIARNRILKKSEI